MEYYPSVKDNDSMKIAGKRVEVEKKIIYNEATQSQKDKRGIFSLISRY